MVEKIRKYYVDEEGLKAYEEKISALEAEYSYLIAGKREDAKAVQVEKYITLETRDIARRELQILEEIKNLRAKRSQIELITKHNDETRTDIGDRLLIEIMYAPDDVEEEEITLVGTIASSLDKPDEVSINSPLGRAIFGLELGSISSYTVENNKISVHIIKKLVLEDKPITRN